MKSKKEALDDAISATKAPVAEGIVPGGGLALLLCIATVADEEQHCEGDERTGVQIIKRALEAPVRQIAENSAVDGGVVIAKMLEGTGNFGFDAGRKEYVDLAEAGIVGGSRHPTDQYQIVRISDAVFSSRIFSSLGHLDYEIYDDGTVMATTQAPSLAKAFIDAVFIGIYELRFSRSEPGYEMRTYKIASAPEERVTSNFTHCLDLLATEPNRTWSDRPSRCSTACRQSRRC